MSLGTSSAVELSSEEINHAGGEEAAPSIPRSRTVLSGLRRSPFARTPAVRAEGCLPRQLGGSVPLWSPRLRGGRAGGALASSIGRRWRRVTSLCEGDVSGSIKKLRAWRRCYTLEATRPEFPAAAP